MADMEDIQTDLQALEGNLTDLMGPVFRVLKATLEYPAKPEVKASKLADDVTFFTKGDNGDAVLWQVWWVIFDIASVVPPDHAWQDSLVQCLSLLRERDEVITPKIEVRNSLKKNEKKRGGEGGILI